MTHCERKTLPGGKSKTQNGIVRRIQHKDAGIGADDTCP